MMKIVESPKELEELAQREFGPGETKIWFDLERTLNGLDLVTLIRIAKPGGAPKMRQFLIVKGEK